MQCPPDNQYVHAVILRNSDARCVRNARSSAVYLRQLGTYSALGSRGVATPGAFGPFGIQKDIKLLHIYTQFFCFCCCLVFKTEQFFQSHSFFCGNYFLKAWFCLWMWWCKDSAAVFKWQDRCFKCVNLSCNFCNLCFVHTDYSAEDRHVRTGICGCDGRHSL